MRYEEFVLQASVVIVLLLMAGIGIDLTSAGGSQNPGLPRV
jgi:hypothetical protein